MRVQGSGSTLRRGIAVVAGVFGVLALSACTAGLGPSAEPSGPAPTAPVTEVMHPHGDASLWLDNAYSRGVTSSENYGLASICAVSSDGVVAGEMETADGRAVTAFDLATGTRLWEHPDERCAGGDARANTMLMTSDTSSGRAVKAVSMREGATTVLGGISGGPSANQVSLIDVVKDRLVWTEKKSGSDAELVVHAASLGTGEDLWTKRFAKDTVCTMREGGIGCRGTSTLTVLSIDDGSMVRDLGAVRENWFAPAVFWDASPASTAGKRTIRGFDGEIIGERPVGTRGDAPRVVPTGVLIDGADGQHAPDAMVMASNGRVVWQRPTVDIADGEKTIETTPAGVTADGKIMLVVTERASALVDVATSEVLAGPFQCEASVEGGMLVCGGQIYPPSPAK